MGKGSTILFHAAAGGVGLIACQWAKSLGATVMKDVTEVADKGWFSIIVDPTGAMLGLWKAKPRAK